MMELYFEHQLKSACSKVFSSIGVLLVFIIAVSANYGVAQNISNSEPTIATHDSITLIGKLSITGLPIHDVWEYTDSTTGTEYALLCASNSGLRVIDLTDKTNPVQVGSISGGGVEAIDVKVWMNYAYVVGESLAISGKIIDLSDPTNPVQAGTFPAAHNIFISDDGYMYLAAPGLRIYELNTDPLNPVEVYNDNSCNGHDVSVIGNRLFDFSDNCGTRIYSIVDPSNPVLLGTVVDNSFFHHSGWTSSDGNYLFICDELASPTQNDIVVWDISDPASPFKVDSFYDPNAYVHNFYVIGDYAYVSYYRAGFRVFDITDPTQITLYKEYDTDSALTGPGYGGNYGLYPFNPDGKILASDEGNGLYIFTFSGQVIPGIASAVLPINDLKLFPNPASGTAVLSFDLDVSQSISAKIYDLSGREIRTVLQRELNPDQYNLEINLKGLRSGSYILELRIGERTLSKKFIVLQNDK